MNVPGYEQLADVLTAAYEQAAKGKGAERHADGKPFHEQPMQTGSDLLGTDAGLAFQAIKKLREGMAFTDIDRWEREALGAINYIAGMVIWRRRQAAMMGCEQGARDEVARGRLDQPVAAVNDAGSLPTIKRSELPAWVPADAEWFAAPCGNFGAEHAYRAAPDGQPQHCGYAYSWIVAGRWDSIDDLRATRPELMRIIDDTPAATADPFMPPDTLWLAWPLANFSVMNLKGEFRMMQRDPALLDPCEFVAGTIRQRPAHLRSEAATNGQ